jgi:AAA15 family ATPase/GTPase
MLRSFTLKNFRCFQNLTLEPLERVNLIAGKNNVGKTSLLEAIFIFINPTNPESLFQINRLRRITKSSQFKEVEEMKLFFFDQDIDKVIILSSVGEDNLQRSLRIRFPELGETQLSILAPLYIDNDSDFIGNESLITENRQYSGFFMEYEDPTSNRSPISIYVTPDRGLTSRYRRQKFPVGIYLTTSTRSPREDAERFSNLERVGRQDEVLTTLRLLEPRLQRLTLLVVEREPIIHGDIGMSELVPLPLMGEGIGRLFSIILAITNAKGGTILIDEIENGLHYSVLTNVWKAIAETARRADVQIFATTHSQECIRAAHKAFESSNKYDFRYHRLERVKDEIRAVTYNQETLATSDEMNLEMR